MAITDAQYRLIKALRQQGRLPERCALMELGEQNWYADAPTMGLLEDIAQFAPPARRQALADELRGYLQSGDPGQYFYEIAKIFYATFLDPSVHDAIDFHGTELAKKIDLNYPVEIERQYDLVINGGTAEHIFDIAQFFRTVHAMTKPGGLMIHEMPVHGFFDHGFYNFQPTFYFDLAATNNYRLVGLFYVELMPTKLQQLQTRQHWIDFAAAGNLRRDATVIAILRREGEGEFRVPRQAVYADDSRTEEVADAWRTLRHQR